MTPFGKSVATELRSALVPIETTSIADYRHLPQTVRALLHNALFYVVATPRIAAARDRALTQAERLAAAIHEVGVQPLGISLVVDQARADALVALQALIDGVADAEPTQTAKSLGIG